MHAAASNCRFMLVASVSLPLAAQAWGSGNLEVQLDENGVVDVLHSTKVVVQSAGDVLDLISDMQPPEGHAKEAVVVAAKEGRAANVPTPTSNNEQNVAPTPSQHVVAC